MSFGFVDPWHLFLPREGGHVLSFMGSGGKTGLMRVVADVYADEGIQTILTTTTRCEVLADVVSLSWAELQVANPAELPTTVFVHAGPVKAAKWQGLAPDQVDELGRMLPDRVVLVEVDGAAKRPLKLYRAGEPVWPGRTSLVFVVMGVAAVGGTISEKVHRWGRLEFAALADLPDYAVLEWSHLAEMLLAANGYLAQVPAAVPTVLALTGLAEQDDSIGLFEFVGQAMSRPELPLAMFCSLGGEEPAIRTACVERGDEPQ